MPGDDDADNDEDEEQEAKVEKEEEEPSCAPTNRPRAKTLAKAKANQKPMPAGEGGRQPRRDHKDVDDASPADTKKVVASATRLKTRYVKALMGADYLVKQIKEDSAWRWASASCTTANFTEAVDALRAAETSFTKAWHTHDLSDVKKQYTHEAIIAGCQNYIDAFSKLIERVENETKKLAKSHLVMATK